MGKKGYLTIPRTLLDCITFLARALPIRSVPTFIELLVGTMITSAGFVTEAWLAIDPLRSWTAYYKWLQQGKWSWVALGVQLARLVVSFFPQPLWFLIFDDTFIYRSSKKAPGSGVYHQHGNKANRPQYARGQCWVTLALSIGSGMKQAAVPLLTRLMRNGSNHSKLDAAKLLLKFISPVFADNKRSFTLVDSWYMKWPYLSANLLKHLIYFITYYKSSIFRHKHEMIHQYRYVMTLANKLCHELIRKINHAASGGVLDPGYVIKLDRKS